MHSIRIIGPGRAGTSLAAALSARGWAFAGFSGRGDDLSGAARGVDVLVIATPDDAIAEVAAAVEPVAGTTVVAPLGLARARRPGAAPAAGGAPPARAPAQRRGRRSPAVLGCDVRGGRVRRRRARSPSASGAVSVEVADGDRAAYHAAACIAANHVVALLGQVERVAASVGLDLESFLPLARAAVDDVAALGAERGTDRSGPSGRLGDAQPPPRCLARGRARRLPGRGGAGRRGWPSNPRRGRDAGGAGDTRPAVASPCRRHRPCRRRSRSGRRARWTPSRPSPGVAPCWTTPVRRVGWSGWCRPWARCTTDTARSWRGPAPSATSWRSASS